MNTCDLSKYPARSRWGLKPQWNRRLLIMAMAGCAATIIGCSHQPPALRESPAPRVVNIDSRTDGVLRTMSQTLSNARSLSFRSDAVMDERVESGQLAQFSRHGRCLIQRPDQLFMESRQGDKTWMLWHRGSTVTVLNKTANTYATSEVPANNDAMLDHLAKQYGVVIPVAELVFPDPYKVLTAEVQSGRFVGTSTVRGVSCDHLLFSQEGVDWQIWIDRNKALPRKIVIDHRNMPGEPQFSAELSDWNLGGPIGADAFTPQLPQGAKKVGMAELFHVEGE